MAPDGIPARERGVRDAVIFCLAITLAYVLILYAATGTASRNTPEAIKRRSVAVLVVSASCEPPRLARPVRGAAPYPEGCACACAALPCAVLLSYTNSCLVSHISDGQVCSVAWVPAFALTPSDGILSAVALSPGPLLPAAAAGLACTALLFLGPLVHAAFFGGGPAVVFSADSPLFWRNYIVVRDGGRGSGGSAPATPRRQPIAAPALLLQRRCPHPA